MHTLLKSPRYSPIEQLMQEVIATIDRDPELDDEWMNLDEEPVSETKKPAMLKPDIEFVAAALANAYKAGLQAGHIRGLSPDEHDASDTQFWHVKAAGLVNYIKSKATELEIVVEPGIAG